MSVATVTPWRDLLSLLPGYATATQGARPVIVDNSTDPRISDALRGFCAAREGAYVRYEGDGPFSYARACNLGLDAARALGATHAVCLNNDVEGMPEWLAEVEALPDGVLAGPEIGQLVTAGQPHLYVSGWCVAATMATWVAVGGWDAEAYVGCYHEDVDLSWRAARAGVYLRMAPWALRHLGDTTSRATPGAYDHHGYNRSVFAARVRAWKGAA